MSARAPVIPAWARPRQPVDRARIAAEVEAAHKAAVAERQRAYRERNKAAVAERQRAYRERNKAAVAEYQRAYYERNKAAVAERQRAYRERNKAAVAERKRKKGGGWSCSRTG